MAVTNCSPGEATRRHRTASVLRMLPAVREALRAGRIGVAQVHLLAKLAANPRVHDKLAGSEPVLLEAAQELRYEDFKIVCQRWEQLADADGAHRDHERSLAHRNASIVEVDGEFECVPGRRRSRARSCARSSSGSATPSTAPIGKRPSPSTASGPARVDAAHRRATPRRCMMAIFEAAATAGIDGVPLEIVLNLVMDHDQFEQYTREQLDGTPVAIDPATVRDRRCETVEASPSTPVRRWRWRSSDMSAGSSSTAPGWSSTPAAYDGCSPARYATSCR